MRLTAGTEISSAGARLTPTVRSAQPSVCALRSTRASGHRYLAGRRGIRKSADSLIRPRSRNAASASVGYAQIGAQVILGLTQSIWMFSWSTFDLQILPQWLSAS